ncbi:MAG: thioredoxin family protein [Erysipelotrichaceae bacterium]|nr:thioredoxin family protein [Erysipelotrichaceae bacterium]
MANIYKIEDIDIEEFIGYHNTKKVILYYKQDCVFCKMQIDDLDRFASTYKDNIEYAICDIKGKSKFCVSNGIDAYPTIQIYDDGKLIKQFDAYHSYDELVKEIL